MALALLRGFGCSWSGKSLFKGSLSSSSLAGGPSPSTSGACRPTSLYTSRSPLSAIPIRPLRPEGMRSNLLRPLAFNWPECNNLSKSFTRSMRPWRPSALTKCPRASWPSRLKRNCRSSTCPCCWTPTPGRRAWQMRQTLMSSISMSMILKKLRKVA